MKIKQITINNDNDYQLLINLEAKTVIPGTYISADFNTPDDYRFIMLDNLVDKNVNIINKKYITNNKIISNYDEVIDHFKDSENKYFITGITESKIDLILKYFNKENFKLNTKQIIKQYTSDNEHNLVELPNDLKLDTNIRVGVPLTIPGLNLTTMILNDSNFGEYEYVLYLNTENPIKYIDLGNGLAKFKFMRSHVESNETANLLLFDSIIEEPKIISEVFIDRGINSAFERVKKLKNIKNLEELTRTGLGYYKINTKGYNFNN